MFLAQEFFLIKTYLYHEHASSYSGISITTSTNLNVSQLCLTNRVIADFLPKGFISSIMSSIQLYIRGSKIRPSQISISHHGHDVDSPTNQARYIFGYILFDHEISTADRQQLQKCASSIVLPKRNFHLWQLKWVSTETVLNSERFENMFRISKIMLTTEINLE